MVEHQRICLLDYLFENDFIDLRTYKKLIKIVKKDNNKRQICVITDFQQELADVLTS